MTLESLTASVVESFLVPLAPWVLAVEALVVALLAGLVLGLGLLAGVAAVLAWACWGEIAEEDRRA